MTRTLLLISAVALAALAIGAGGAAADTMTSPSLAPGWHLIGLPALPDPWDPYDIFGDVRIDYRLFGWNPTLMGYVTADPLQPDQLPTVVSGEGYWFHADDVSTVSYIGLPWQAGALESTDLGPAGWHLIGNPHALSVPLKYCVIANGATEASPADAVAAQWISLPMYGWNPDLLGYTTVGVQGPPVEDSTALAPWAGYWFNTEVGDLRLMVQRPLGAGPFDAWLVDTRPGYEGMYQDHTVDLSDQIDPVLLMVVAAAPIYATQVRALTSGPTQLVAGNALTLHRGNWPLQMPFGGGFVIPIDADGDYTITIEANTPEGTKNSIVIPLTVIGLETPP